MKYKYYFEFLEQLDEYQHYTYNKKTTYRNGKIINGKSFKLIDRNALIESSYNNEKLVRIDLNLFVMHYFGRYSAELKEDKIIISQFNYPKYLEVSKENNTFVASFYEDNKLLKKGSSETLIKEGSPNSITFYYLKDNKINKLSKPIVFGLKDEEDETDRYLNMIFQMFPIESGNSIQTLFAEVAHNLTEKELGDEWFDSFASDTPFKEENYLSIVQYDDKGQISYGIRVTKQSDNKILLEGYSDNVIKKKIVVNSLKELLANDKQILEKLSYHLLNE